MEEAAFVAGAIAIKSYSEDIHRAKRTGGHLRVRNVIFMRRARCRCKQSHIAAVSGSCDRNDPDVARKAYDGIGAAFARLS